MHHTDSTATIAYACFMLAAVVLVVGYFWITG